MYDFTLNENEIINLISDNTIIYIKDKEIMVSSIITNQRLLFFDYPSSIYNSMEDLRTSGKMTYIRKKEIIEEIYLKDIKTIVKEKDYYKIVLKNKGYININDDKIIEYLNKL